MAKLTEQEVQSLKSGLYNANAAMQHLKVKVAELEGKVEFLRKGYTRVERDLVDVIKDMQELIGELRERRVL